MCPILSIQDYPHEISQNLSLQELTRTNHTDLDNTPGVKEKENLRRLAQLVLQPLRDAWGRPLKVNSAYRSLLVNARVHGARNSYHLRRRPGKGHEAGADMPRGAATRGRGDTLETRSTLLAPRGSQDWR